MSKSRRFTCLALIPLFVGCNGEEQASDTDLVRPEGVESTSVPPVTTIRKAEGQSPSTVTDSMGEWRRTITKTPTPKAGCFRSSYPATDWEEIPCEIAPIEPRDPHTVGGPNNFDFEAGGSGLISWAQGSFPSISPFPDLSNYNYYSLQLNTNFFVTPACSGSPNPSSCLGWQQFLLANDGDLDGSSQVYMQYWLVNYGSPCPSGWMSSQGHCFKNSPAVSPFWQKTEWLDEQMVSGSVSATTDTVTVNLPQGAYAVSNTSVLQAFQGWTSSQFNIFGFCCSGQAFFLGDATLTVRISQSDGTLAAPTCLLGGTTAESNSLTLVRPSCCPMPGMDLGFVTIPPSISFIETNTSVGPPPFCMVTNMPPILRPLL